ncbi:DUF423 domain-containing protein [Sphingobacterium thalpophilum]|uniref:Protein of uncharacterized function (DUF423) n=1 Tax=Sphingobacterium thalpophilum TaxID=259 RepID=A0A4U9W5P7_9SPHI|nr:MULTISPECIES: DUF423 domain-containing protein [Sphingobacterium]MCW8311640.1 DUF423 domain-containing protein [Sphingobacterium sp. InxBP1]VTR54122.1 Protein of uncharacterised function (DUF423) [Sphingobacterium thalpophilum]
MNNIVIITAALLGSLAIILGAFGAHAFKKILPSEKLESFEVGVRYQMYTAITLLILGLNFSFEYQSERIAFYLITLGTLLFSTSIYFLAFAAYWKKNLKFLGPITPLGGLLMIAGWVAIILRFL